MPALADAPRAAGHLPIAGHIPLWQKDPVGLITSAARQGDVVRLGLPGRTYLVTHPAHVKHVLQDNNQNYTKGWVFDRIRPYWGDSLLTAEGQAWKQQRRRVQPSFTRERTAGFAPIVTRRTAEMLARWERPAATGETLAMYHEMARLALVVIGDVLFGIDLWAEAPGMAGAAQTALAVLKNRVAALAPLPLWLPTPDNRRFNGAMRQLHRHIGAMVARARAADGSQRGFLTMLMEARDSETGERMSDRQLHEETLGMLQQGHDTVGETLAWTWYLLSRHPAADAAMREEIAQVVGDRVPELADLPKLPYVHMVLQESMRLFPPVWVIPRDATHDDAIGGYRVPAGSTILLCPYVTHRRAELWDDAEAFDPLRFLPERAKTRPRYAYFPFGGGPRLCMGADMATMEMMLILVMVAQRFRVRVPDGHREEPECILDMVPRHRVPATLERRPPSAPASEPAHAFAGVRAAAAAGGRCPFHP